MTAAGDVGVKQRRRGVEGVGNLPVAETWKEEGRDVWPPANGAVENSGVD